MKATALTKALAALGWNSHLTRQTAIRYGLFAFITRIQADLPLHASRWALKWDGFEVKK